MPAKQLVDIPWPMKGLVENAAYGNTPDMTTLDCLNVRPYDALEKRLRGGQRTGQSKYLADQVNGSNPIQAIEEVVEAFDPDSVVADQRLYYKDFSALTAGESLQDEDAEWREYERDTSSQMVKTAGGSLALDIETLSGTEYAKGDIATVLDGRLGMLNQTLSIGQAYVIRATFIVPFYAATASSGGFGLVARADETGIAADGALTQFILAGVANGLQTTPNTLSVRYWDSSFPGDSSTATLGTRTFARATEYTVELRVSGNTFNFYVDGGLVGSFTNSNYTSQVGVGFYCSDWTAGPEGPFIKDFEVLTGVAPATLRTTKIVAVSGGTVKAGTPSTGLLLPSNGSGAMSSSGRVAVQEAFQNVFLADGVTANYQYLDLDANEIKDWQTAVTAEVSGTLLPQGSADATKACRIMSLYRGRVALSGLQEDPHNWFMSAVGRPFNWDYDLTAASEALGVGPATQAIAGNNSVAGELGDVVTALAPFQDDVLIMGGANSLWIMQGDPAAGGIIDNISRRIGIVGPDAWTFDTSGNFYFFGNNGLYRLAPNGGTPELVSQNRLDRTFADVDLLRNRVILVYDREWQGVHMFFSPEDQPSTASEHYFWDERTDSFWKDQYPVAHGPTAVQLYNADNPAERAVLIGGYDGYLRFFDSDGTSDDGAAITSRCRFSPIQPGSILASSRVDEILVVTDENGNDVTFKLYAAESPEQADAAADAATNPKFAKTLTPGRTIPMRQRISQNTFVPVIEQTANNTTWAYETGKATAAVLNRMHHRRV